MVLSVLVCSSVRVTPSLEVVPLVFSSLGVSLVRSTSFQFQKPRKRHPLTFSGVMLINVTQALGEMCIVFPVSGGYYTLAARMLDPSFAFAMGWNYVLQWAVVLPLEIVSVSEWACTILY